MTELFALHALLFAGECFAASILLLGLAAVATRFVKHASLRHLVWLTAFGTMLVLPAAALIIPPQIAIHRVVAAEQIAPAPVPSDFAAAASLPVLAPAPAPSWNITAQDVALLLSGLWLLGFAWNALRLLIGAIGTNALQMSGAPVDDDKLPEFAKAQACDVRLASDHTGPMTWGTVRPVILLPEDALSWPPERLHAVLLHELAHARRRDSFAQTLSRIASALYWPNPLVWLGTRALRREAEIAADDAVIGAGVRPSAYASELLQLATEYRLRRHAVTAGLSMASETALEARVKSVLTPDQTRRGVTSMDVVKIAGAGLLAAAALAFVRPSFAEDAPPIPPAPLSAASAVIPPTPPTSLAESDVPPPPPAPPAVDAAPPAPPAPPTMDTPAEPPALATPETGHRHLHMHVDLDRAHGLHLHRLTPEERKEVRAALQDAHREMREAMLKARPEMERAMAEMRMHREELKKLRPRIEEAMREVSPDIERAMTEAHRALEKAHVSARVQRHVEEAMRGVELQLREHRAMRDRDNDNDEAAQGDMHDNDEDSEDDDERGEDDGNR